MIARSRYRTATGVAPSLAILILAELFLRGCQGVVPIEGEPRSIGVRHLAGRHLLLRPADAAPTSCGPTFTYATTGTVTYGEHRTDELGFRNPGGLRDRSLRWLGDSMIYGHGAQEADTALERLRREFGLGAYNAARQGDDLYQECLVARPLLPELHPGRWC